jgi:hypothetical protein
MCITSVRAKAALALSTFGAERPEHERKRRTGEEVAGSLAGKRALSQGFPATPGGRLAKR